MLKVLTETAMGLVGAELIAATGDPWYSILQLGKPTSLGTVVDILRRPAWRQPYNKSDASASRDWAVLTAWKY